MNVAILLHVNTNDHEKLHSLMLGIFSQSHIKKSVFVSISENSTTPEIHKLIAGARDQSVVPIHMVPTARALNLRSNSFTERLNLLKHAFQMDFEAFAFAEVGTVWKPTKLASCLERISDYRIEHYLTKPKVCVSDFGVFNMTIKRRVESYCRDISFELTRFLNNAKTGNIKSYPIPSGNLVFDRVAASHVCDEGVSVPIAFEKWILLVCSLGPSNFHVMKETLFEVDWDICSKNLIAISTPSNRDDLKKRNDNLAVVLEAKRQQLERSGLRIGTEKIDLENNFRKRSFFDKWMKKLLKNDERSAIPWCPSRFRQCVEYLSGNSY